MDREEVKRLMESSKSEQEWNDNCGEGGQRWAVPGLLVRCDHPVRSGGTGQCQLGVVMSNLATQLVMQLKEMGLNICTVESCTGGALASAITDVPGASEVFQKGFVTYSNPAKETLDHWMGREGGIGRVIRTHGVYSAQTAACMAEMGAEMAQVGVGITGTLSREDPANPGTPTGIVYIGVVALGNKAVTRFIAVNVLVPRADAKQKVVNDAMRLVLNVLATQQV